MAKNKVKIITIKTVKPIHLHTCQICGSDDTTVTSHHILKNCAGNGIARCENCKAIREF